MKKLEDLRFNLTKNMSYTLICIINIKEKLENDNSDSKSREELQKEFNKLKNMFITDFKLNNKKQIDLYNKIKKERNKEIDNIL